MSTRKVDASLAFLSDSPSDKISMGENAVIVMAEKEQSDRLPNLPITIVALTQLNTDFKGFYQAALGGDHKAIAARNLEEAKWNDAYRLTAKYVGQETKGDKSFILACGFQATTDVTTPTPETTVITNLNVKATDKSGDALVKMDGQNQAAGYMVGLFPVGTTMTQDGGTITITNGTFKCYLTVNTHHLITMQGLPSGEILRAFALAFNLKGLGPITGTANDVRPL